eukprot:m.54118 g.54118  ORF g.54118 m.54118 type:complete len:674 (-) comp7702_c0_seq1:162-2183(-)
MKKVVRKSNSYHDRCHRVLKGSFLAMFILSTFFVVFATPVQAKTVFKEGYTDDETATSLRKNFQSGKSGGNGTEHGDGKPNSMGLSLDNKHSSGISSIAKNLENHQHRMEVLKLKLDKEKTNFQQWKLKLREECKTPALNNSESSPLSQLPSSQSHLSVPPSTVLTKKQASSLSVMFPPVKKFAYVKTHKTGSSTLSITSLNIASAKQLHPIVFMDGVSKITNVIEWPFEVTLPAIQKRISLKANSQDQDAMVSHIAWTPTSASTIYSVLGGRQPTFSIVRDPFDRFLSAVSFFGLKDLVLSVAVPLDSCNMTMLNDDCLSRILDKIEDNPSINSVDHVMQSRRVDYQRQSRKKLMVKKARQAEKPWSKRGLFPQHTYMRGNGWDAINMMNTKRFMMNAYGNYLNSYAVDFGLVTMSDHFFEDLSSPSSLQNNSFWAPENSATRSAFQKNLDELDNRLDLVLITNRWSESMIYLRYFMQLPIEDVMWWSEKTAETKHVGIRRSKVSLFSENTRSRFRRIFWRDYMVYEKYSAIFDKKMTMLRNIIGTNAVDLEIKELKTRQSKIEWVCEFFSHIDPLICLSAVGCSMREGNVFDVREVLSMFNKYDMTELVLSKGKKCKLLRSHTYENVSMENVSGVRSCYLGVYNGIKNIPNHSDAKVRELIRNIIKQQRNP